MDVDTLKRKSAEVRKRTLEMIFSANAGHIGGSLSETDILVALFYDVMRFDATNPKWDKRDRFILSKGHSVEAYYVILSDLGFFPDEELNTFGKFGSQIIGHPNNKIPGVEMNSGALGHGLSIAVGMALSAKLTNQDYRTFVLMGDGELAEGSVWEAAMAASKYRLDNLIAIIDRNSLQITGETEKIMPLEPLADKWRAFGFNVLEVNGHDFEQLRPALQKSSDRPMLVLAHTIKGRGVPFMENQASWHHGVPSEEQLAIAMKDLNEALI